MQYSRPLIERPDKLCKSQEIDIVSKVFVVGNQASQNDLMASLFRSYVNREVNTTHKSQLFEDQFHID